MFIIMIRVKLLIIAGRLLFFFNSLVIKIDKGVLPVPPKYIFPTQITGILKEFSYVVFFFNQNNQLKQK